jgi:hypothetical protein
MEPLDEGKPKSKVSRVGQIHRKHSTRTETRRDERIQNTLLYWLRLYWLAGNQTRERKMIAHRAFEDLERLGCEQKHLKSGPLVRIWLNNNKRRLPQTEGVVRPLEASESDQEEDDHADEAPSSLAAAPATALELIDESWLYMDRDVDYSAFEDPFD